MKVGDKIKFIRHNSELSKVNNGYAGLIIGDIYTVLSINNLGDVEVNAPNMGNYTIFRSEYELVEPKTDPIVESVLNLFRERSAKGIATYGTTLQENNLSVLEWLNHLQEEMMDATLYIQRLKDEVVELEKLKQQRDESK